MYTFLLDRIIYLTLIAHEYRRVEGFKRSSLAVEKSVQCPRRERSRQCVAAELYIESGERIGNFLRCTTTLSWGCGTATYRRLATEYSDVRPSVFSVERESDKKLLIVRGSFSRRE